jgi:hypothetical protein
MFGSMAVAPHPYGRVFTAGVGVGGEPISDDWTARDQDYLWFLAPNRQVSRDDHMFALAAGRGSVVVRLFEVGSGGFEQRRPLPEWNNGRGPWALGVRALVEVPPREAIPVEGIRAPRRTAAQVTDPALQAALYDAVQAGGRILGIDD